MHVSLLLASALPLLLAGAGILYYALCLWAARSFAREVRVRLRTEAHDVPVSVLKPVKGLDPDLAEAVRSHCRQQYEASFELLFGVSSLDDPAVPVLRAIAAEFPHLRIEIVQTPLTLGTNGKISNLVQLLPHARYQYILIADADISVGPRYLRRITAPFVDGEVGLVTAPYRGRMHPPDRPTFGSRMEALGLSTDFFPGVLAARLTDGGVRFGLGSTLLISRTALDKVAGLEPLVNLLADDYELGARVSAAGFRVVLSEEPVSTSVPAYTFAEFWAHQQRWARTVRDARPWSYLGLLFTQAVPWALLGVVANGGSVNSLLLLSLALISRWFMALSLGFGLLADNAVPRNLLWLPLRDCLAFAIWVWSYAGDSVEWRGERFHVRGGRLVRANR